MKYAIEVKTGKKIEILNARLFDLSKDKDEKGIAFNVSYHWWMVDNGEMVCGNCDGPYELCSEYGNEATLRPVIEFNDDSIETGSILKVKNDNTVYEFVVYEKNRAISLTGTDNLGFGDNFYSDITSSSLLNLEDGCIYDVEEVDDPDNDIYISVDKIINGWFNDIEDI